jgi:adenylosuccinate synthase
LLHSRRDGFRMRQKEKMCKRGPEVGAVHGRVARGTGHENVPASRAEDVDGADAGVVGEADGEDGLRTA